MGIKASFWLSTIAIGLVLGACQGGSTQHHSADPSLAIGEKDLGGIVTSAYGPEAGVWVIAETRDLPTPFARIVVTDERGRYVIPDLPKASYDVWVRGYGLIDSAKVPSVPGKIVDLRAVVALTPSAAAAYYPAIYWYSMLKIPDTSALGATRVKTQSEWLNVVKTNGCITCHQIGNKATRTLPKTFAHIGSSSEAWSTRILSGQAMSQMVNAIGRIDPQLALSLFADWTDRIGAGELPATQPPRPAGLERNLVITLWDWSRPTAYMHDEISTDKRNPTVNRNGLIFGAPEESTDYIPVLDPVRHTATEVRHPVRDPKTPSSKTLPFSQSPYWGTTPIWDSQTSMHNPMFDERARVWFTARVRSPENPAFCRRGSNHPSARSFPLERANRHLSMYEPKTGMFTLISTCFPTHHLVFAEDTNHTLWTSSGGAGGEVVGWLNRRLFEETGDEERSQGWTPLILDTNGNGKRDDYAEPDQPLDPARDKRIAAGLYGIAVSPVDGSVWGSALGFPGTLIRLNPGPNPTETALAEVFEYPLHIGGYGVRGMDIDRNGVTWSSLASGHLASFDRRKCKGPLNGPKATGKHCPEGWTLYRFPGPQFESVTESGSAESSYYTWVDQFDTLGLGRNVPIATGNLNDGLLALADGQFVTLRVPYPLGFYAKWMDGRIDDPSGGWKGKGLWATTSTRAPFHMEGGSGARPKVVKFQLRPDPLAR
jgi:hypothetical protein